ncbi:hypothetical protein DB346_08185 [Verrucomicrobia bacterium LW23]|nr:hypothetical protein DB346_08185 [Verrucomicrobia bacterium LW23]
MASASMAFMDGPTLEASELPPLLTVEDGVGTIRISGALMRRPDIFSVIFFGASDIEEIAAAVRDAARRPDVEALFLDIDSPGGTVSGTPELAQAVADASREKYVYAFTSGLMCSAAYWVASQADAIYATPSARVGSIGVILPLIDSSEAYRQEGLRVEVFAAGKFKGAGVPGTSLTDAQREMLQADIDEIAGDFKRAVLSRGRKIGDDAMEGQTFSARNAQRLNLAGAIKDRETALERLRALHVRGNSGPRTVDTRHKVMTIESTSDLAASAPDRELSIATARILKLEADAGASDALLAESARQIETLSGQVELQATEIQSLTAERDKLRHEAEAARKSAAELSAKNAELAGKEQDIAKRASREAARIVAETGTTMPANVTPRGDQQPGTASGHSVTGDALLAQFAAISDPKEQTVFWRGLSDQQKAFILNHSGK